MLNDMDDDSVPNITLDSTKNHIPLKERWHKDVQSLVDSPGIEEEFIL